MSTNSVALLTRDGFIPGADNRYVIAFAADGTCDFESVVSVMGDYQSVAVSGKWKLEHDTRGGSNILKKNVLRLDLPIGRLNYILRLNFAHEDHDLILWSYHGDPDMWEFIEYERQD